MNKEEETNTSKDSDSDDSEVLTSQAVRDKRQKVNLSSFRDKNGNPIHVKFENNTVHIVDEQRSKSINPGTDRSALPSRRSSHSRVESETSIIDRRPRRPSPFRSHGEEHLKMMSEAPDQENSGKAKRQTSKSGYHPVPLEEETFESIGLKPVSLGSSLKLRKGKHPTEGLVLDTDVNGNSKENTLLIPKGTTSAVSPAISRPFSYFSRRKKDSSLEQNTKPKVVLEPKGTNNDSDYSDQESRQFIERRTNILSKIDQNEAAAIDQIPIEEGRETTRQYLKLIEYLGLSRIYFDPELEIINRFCLEYTALCVKTDDNSFFRLGSQLHFKRVFEALETRTNSIGTPTDRFHPGPDVPVLLTRLVLGEFRVKSNGKNNANISVPLFSHQQRLDAKRFERIVTQVFDRKRYFEKSIDISRHGLEHLA